MVKSPLGAWDRHRRNVILAAIVLLNLPACLNNNNILSVSALAPSSQISVHHFYLVSKINLPNQLSYT